MFVVVLLVFWYGGLSKLTQWMTESFPSQRRPHPETRSALCDPTPLQTAYWRYGVLLGTHKARLPWKLPELRPHSLLRDFWVESPWTAEVYLPQALLERQTFLLFLDPLWLWHLPLSWTSFCTSRLLRPTAYSALLLRCLTGISDVAPKTRAPDSPFKPAPPPSFPISVKWHLQPHPLQWLKPEMLGSSLTSLSHLTCYPMLNPIRSILDLSE